MNNKNLVALKKLLIILFLILSHLITNAQSVGIGTTTPDSSAVLEIKSANKGFLLPRLLDTGAILNPAKGLVIFNESDSTIWFYNGMQWQQNANVLPSSDSIWKMGENINTILTNKNHVSVHPNSTMPIPQNAFSVFNDLVVQQYASISTATPTTATMNNTFTTQTFNTDKVVYDPAGPGVNYFNNMVGKVKIWDGVLANRSYHVSFDGNDFGLSTGDTLWISLVDYPACITDHILMLTNTISAPPDFNINTQGDGFRIIFKANSDGINNKGFAITSKLIILFSNSNFGIANSTYGNALRFNPNTGSFLAGRQQGAMGIGSAAFGHSVASGENSFAAMTSEAKGDFSIAIGYGAKAKNERAIAIGALNNANVVQATVIGNNNTANGNESTLIGKALTSNTYREFVTGSTNLTFPGTSPNTWVSTDPLFTIGNGLFTPSNALVVYKNANVDINGFTRLGKLSEGAPVIKVKKLTGISAATVGGISDVTHGLNRAKIIGVQVIMKLPAFVDLGPGSRANIGYEYEYQVLNSVIRIANVNGNSANILSKDFVVLVTYEE